VKKAQTPIVYQSLLILISLIFLSGVFALSTAIREDSTEEIGTYLISNVLARVERSMLDLKTTANISDSTQVISTISIPYGIGEEKYILSGKNQTLTIQTFGENAFLKHRKIYWLDSHLQGAVFSSGGEVRLNFSESNNLITIS